MRNGNSRHFPCPAIYSPVQIYKDAELPGQTVLKLLRNSTWLKHCVWRMAGSLFFLSYSNCTDMESIWQVHNGNDIVWIQLAENKPTVWSPWIWSERDGSCCWLQRKVLQSKDGVDTNTTVLKDFKKNLRCLLCAQTFNKLLFLFAVYTEGDKLHKSRQRIDKQETHEQSGSRESMEELTDKPFTFISSYCMLQHAALFTTWQEITKKKRKNGTAIPVSNPKDIWRVFLWKNYTAAL